MKRLRILTGHHAGTQLSLTQRLYTLGSNADADIQLSDWPMVPMKLVLKSRKPAMLLPIPADGEFGEQVVPWARLSDFVPVRVKELVLCIGPDNDDWPSDMALLSRLLHPNQTRTGSSSSRALWGGAMACGLALAIFTGLMFKTTSDARAQAPVVADLPLSQQVMQALQTAGLSSLQVQALGPQVVVKGVLDNTAQVAQARQLLHDLSSDHVVHQYAAASSLSQTMTETLGQPGLSVRYSGHGVFTVTGGVLEPDKLRAATQRIVTDMAPLVSRIDVEVQTLPAPQRVKVGAVLSGDAVSYVQSSDGVKHLSFEPSPGATPGLAVASPPSSTLIRSLP